MDKLNIIITTFPFGQSNSKSLRILQDSGHNIVMNPLGRRISSEEMPEIIKDFDVVIAGTELISIEALEKSKVKAIFRVGIGLDSVPLNYCYNNDIEVGYTPDAPSQAVAELTLANIINLSRFITKSNDSVRRSEWNRHMGYLLEEMTIGLVGLGRIGSKVARLLQPFNTKIIASEIVDKSSIAKKYNIEIVDKETLFKSCDLVSLHIPNNKANFNYVNKQTLKLMKKGSFLINTARGPVVNENDLYDALQDNLSGAALDVFDKEPYQGKLTELDNIIFTAHIGASAKKSRFLMELEAANDCLNFLNNKPLKNNALIEENLLQSSL